MASNILLALFILLIIFIFLPNVQTSRYRKSISFPNIKWLWLLLAVSIATGVIATVMNDARYYVEPTAIPTTPTLEDLPGDDKGGSGDNLGEPRVFPTTSMRGRDVFDINV